MAVLSLWSMVTLSALFQYVGHTLALENKKLHHHMSAQELRSVFQVDRHDEVPEYEVINVKAGTPYASYQEDNVGPPKNNISDIWSVLDRLSEIRRPRSDLEQERRRPDNLEEIEEDQREVHLSAFGRDLQLKLKKNSGLLGKGVRMWETLQNTSNVNGVEFKEILQEEEDLGTLYQDERNQAALLVHNDKDGRLLLEGTIGHDLVVKPVPASIRHIVTQPDDEMFLDGKDEDIQNDVTMDSGRHLSNADNPATGTRQRRHVASPSTATYHHHIVFKRAGAQLEDDYSDYALMEPDHLGKKNRRRRGISKREAPYVIFPEILVIVDYDGYRLDMCRRQFANDACNRGTAGFAYVGGACVVNKRLEKVNSVAIIEDTGGFSGIIVAAHEVGHLLGAVHDGSPPPSYLGGPGAEKCRWEDGYIMSDLRHTEKGFRWSSCSVASFHHFLNGDTATCLYNAPHEDDSLPRVLPGKLLSLDAQCRKDRGTSACFKDDRVCSQLFCFDAGSGYCVAYRPAAEGSPCGDGQYCMNGKCVAEHENIIPDYSQNTPSYIRRDDFENLATQSRPVYVFPNATSTTKRRRKD